MVLGEFTALGHDPRIFLNADGNFVPLSTGEVPMFSAVSNARGTLIIQNFDGLKLMPSEFLCDHPELLRRFRADDIREFQIDGLIFDWTDRGLHSLNGLTELRALRLDNVGTLNDEALNTISSMHRLDELGISQGDITPQAFSKCAALRCICSLKLTQTKDVASVIKAIHESPHLRFLTLLNCVVTRESVRLIAGLPNLHLLDINHDSSLTDATLEPLSKCRRLKLLRLDCKMITPKIAQTLKSLKLDELDTSLDEPASSELARILYPCVVNQFKQPANTKDKHLLQAIE